MKTISFMKVGIVVLVILSGFSQLTAQSLPNVDCSFRGGVGIATPTSEVLSPFVANASMTVDSWLSDRWKLGVEVSYTQMELKNQKSPVLSKEHLVNQFFVGPSIAISSLRSNQSSWSVQGSLSIGYTLLLKNKAKDGSELLGNYESFNKVQHGFGMNLNAELRKSIGHYYVGVGSVYSSRMLQVGTKEDHTTSFISIMMPQLVFGLTW